MVPLATAGCLLGFAVGTLSAQTTELRWKSARSGRVVTSPARQHSQATAAQVSGHRAAAWKSADTPASTEGSRTVQSVRTSAEPARQVVGQWSSASSATGEAGSLVHSRESRGGLSRQTSRGKPQRAAAIPSYFSRARVRQVSGTGEAAGSKQGQYDPFEQGPSSPGPSSSGTHARTAQRVDAAHDPFESHEEVPSAPELAEPRTETAAGSHSRSGLSPPPARRPPAAFASQPSQTPPSQFPFEGEEDQPRNGDRPTSEELTCQRQAEQLRRDLLSELEFDIHVDGEPETDFPAECYLDGSGYPVRHWHSLTYTWKASALCHKPLYFDDEQLERYGHEWGPVLQPVVSATKFYANVFILPYKMGLRTPNECVYALGHYRPGNCAPYMIDPLGFTVRAGLFEAGAVIGLAAVLP